jgi:hypothetical protein
VAFKRLRDRLSVDGRAPRLGGPGGYEWFNSPDIRFLSIVDFEEFCRAKAVQVHRRIALDTQAGTHVVDDPNRNADLAIFVVSRP